MKIRMLMLGLVLVVVAAVAVPAVAFAATTGDTAISGTITPSSISVSAPVNFTIPLAVADNYVSASGLVTAVLGTTATGWTLTAVGGADNMYSTDANSYAGAWLIDPFYISWSGDTGSYVLPKTTGLTYSSGSSYDGAFNIYTEQTVTHNDVAGTYSITITFTGKIDF